MDADTPTQYYVRAAMSERHLRARFTTGAALYLGFEEHHGATDGLDAPEIFPAGGCMASREMGDARQTFVVRP